METFYQFFADISNSWTPPSPTLAVSIFYTPLSCTSFQCKIRGVFRFLLKFGLYLNVKVHNIPFGTLTPLFNTKDLIHTSNNSKKKKNGNILPIFCWHQQFMNTPPPSHQQPSAFCDPLPPQKCWRNLWTTPYWNNFSLHKCLKMF